jgi:zinc protease
MGNDSSAQYFPTKSEIEEFIAETASIGIEPNQQEVIDPGLLKEAVVQGTIVKKTYYEKADITKLELSNGAKVLLKPTKFKQNEINFWAYSPGGLSVLNPKLIPLKILANPIIQNSGIGPYSKQELFKKLMTKTIQLSVFVDDYEEGIKGNFSPIDMESFFQMISLGITQPRLDNKAFEEQKIKYAQETKQTQSTASWKFQRKIIETSWPDNEYSQPITEKTIMGLDSVLCKKILEERFQNAADFTFQFVGNFEIDKILPLIEKYLAGLPTGEKEQAKDLKLKPLPGRHNFSINENLEDKSDIIIQLNHEYTFTEKRGSEFFALQTLLNMKIMEELRERKGLIYSERTDFQFYNARPEPYSQITFYLSCSPENVESVIDGLKTILKDLREVRITEEKIEEIKKTAVNYCIKARDNNNWWSSALRRDLVLPDFDFNDLVNYEPFIQELTPDTLQACAKKYLDESNMVIGVLNPKKGK